MGLSWQQGPLAAGAAGRFLVPGPLPERMLFAEPLRRRMRVRFGGEWIADSEDVVLLHEPGRYPVAYFPLAAVAVGVLEPSGYTTDHPGLGPLEPDKAEVLIDGIRLRLEPGQTVVPHGIDRDLTLDEAAAGPSL
jgi:hypothetical protein